MFYLFVGAEDPDPAARAGSCGGPMHQTPSPSSPRAATAASARGRTAQALPAPRLRAAARTATRPPPAAARAQGRPRAPARDRPAGVLGFAPCARPLRPLRRHDPPPGRGGPRRDRPLGPGMVQPASVDLRLGDSFRVFHNHRAAAIDLRDPPTNLTEEVVIEGDEPFVIHPASSRSAARRSTSRSPTTSSRGSRASRRARPPRADRPRDRRLRRPRLQGHADARDHQPHPRPDQALRRAPDRPALVHGARRAGRAPIRARPSSARTTRARPRDRVRYGRRGAVCRHAAPSSPTLLAFAAEAPRRSPRDRPSTSWAARRGVGDRAVRRRDAPRPFPGSSAARGDRLSACWSSWPRWPARS